jgi:hypothetical protein
MTPQEKAKQLYDKFDEILPCEGTTTGRTPIDCALILVDEILADELEIMPAKWMSDYWQKVKEELEKL